MVAALVVGQEINLDTGITNLSGRVVKITWWSVYVQQIWENQRGEIVGGEILRFDKEGIECGVHPMSEIGPMEVDEVPFAELAPFTTTSVYCPRFIYCVSLWLDF